MTCIVGWLSNREQGIAGDSCGMDQAFGYHIRRDPKVFKLLPGGAPGKPMLIGFTSSFRFGQLLMTLALPQDVSRDPFDYMVHHFVPAVRTVLREGGALWKQHEVESAGFALIVYRRRIFEMQSDLQIAVHSKPFAALGSGAEFAMGALSAMHSQRKLTSADAVKAIRIASQFNAGVRLPAKVLVA